MASYSSYKQISSDQVAAGSVPSSAIASGTFSNWCVKWIHGAPNQVCTTGCCCAWTVPTNVTRVTWKYGVLEVTDTENVTVTVVETGTLLVEDIITQKLIVQVVGVYIPSVLVEFTDVVQENVWDVKDVPLM